MIMSVHKSNRLSSFPYFAQIAEHMDKNRQSAPIFLNGPDKKDLKVTSICCDLRQNMRLGTIPYEYDNLCFLHDPFIFFLFTNHTMVTLLNYTDSKFW